MENSCKWKRKAAGQYTSIGCPSADWKIEKSGYVPATDEKKSRSLNWGPLWFVFSRDKYGRWIPEEDSRGNPMKRDTLRESKALVAELEAWMTAVRQGRKPKVRNPRAKS